MLFSLSLLSSSVPQPNAVEVNSRGVVVKAWIRRSWQTWGDNRLWQLAYVPGPIRCVAKHVVCMAWPERKEMQWLQLCPQFNSLNVWWHTTA